MVDNGSNKDWRKCGVCCHHCEIFSFCSRPLSVLTAVHIHTFTGFLLNTSNYHHELLGYSALSHIILDNFRLEIMKNISSGSHLHISHH